MKKLFQTTLLLTALFVSTVSFAHYPEDHPIKPSVELRSEILTILGEIYPFEIEKEITFEVTFLINDKNELIVLSSTAKNDKTNHYIKKLMDYQKITSNSANKNQLYLLPIKLKPSSEY